MALDYLGISMSSFATGHFNMTEVGVCNRGISEGCFSAHEESLKIAKEQSELSKADPPKNERFACGDSK